MTARTELRLLPLECQNKATTEEQTECRDDIVKNKAIVEVYLLDTSYAVYSEFPRYTVSLLFYALPIRLLASSFR